MRHAWDGWYMARSQGSLGSPGCFYAPNSFQAYNIRLYTTNQNKTIMKTFDRLPRNDSETDSEYYWRLIDTLAPDGLNCEADAELDEMLSYLWKNADRDEVEKMNNRPNPTIGR